MNGTKRMFIKNISIRNFRLFSSTSNFCVENINIPDDLNEGSGITIFVGENGCGKTSLLDAFSLPLLSYKADAFNLKDFEDPNSGTLIKILANNTFEVAKTVPRGTFQAKGFEFYANIRTRDNKSYLSSVVVSDQKFIKVEEQNAPNDNSPDLRINVNNPYKGKRFDKNDVLYLDKNRIFQIRSGTYNKTRFDKLMEDFTFQFIRGKGGNIDDISSTLDDAKQYVENEFLVHAIDKFEELSGYRVSLNLIDNWHPFKSGFFAIKRDNHQQTFLSDLGSGYEMIFALLYSFYLSQQAGKKLIVLIDEPELHLHPSLQADFVHVLLELSKSAQILLTTHSPLFTKQLFYNENIDARVLSRNADDVEIVPLDEQLLPYVSANEINYLAFGLVTEEYHNELYEELQYRYGERFVKPFDVAYFQEIKGVSPDYNWMDEEDQVSMHTHVRNQIHHARDNGRPELDDMRFSIEKMREYFKEDYD